MSNMRKMSAREFQHSFAKTAESLKPGESVAITKHGKALGTFTRAAERHVKMPDFVKMLEETKLQRSLGDQILKEFNDSLS